MTLGSELADIKWLTGGEAGAILAELAENSDALHSIVARLRKSFSLARTHILLEQVELRRRAAAKFAHAAQMFFTRVGLEQATDEWVARYKAERFRGRGPVADLCCGIGGDLLALAESGCAIGVDRDPITAHLAGANSGAKSLAEDVADYNFDGIDAWHIDPDRRPTGRRTTSIDRCQPNLTTIERLLNRVPNAAVKLAPATKPPADWKERCEFEWISRDRECRQLVAWHGGLAVSPGNRRATILSSASADHGLAPRTITGTPDQTVATVAQPKDYVFDVDPAVIAARLSGALASEHNLASLGAGPTYLTGPQRIDDHALPCFRIEDALPLRVGRLAQYLQTRNVGQLEIKKRGVDIDPEQLRRDLKLRGENSATILITNVARRPTAILATRMYGALPFLNE